MSLLIIDFMGLLGSIRSIEFYPLQKLQELVFVKEVYKSDKRKSQHIMLTFFGSIISVVGKTTVELIELFKCTQKVP